MVIIVHTYHEPFTYSEPPIWITAGARRCLLKKTSPAAYGSGPAGKSQQGQHLQRSLTAAVFSFSVSVLLELQYSTLPWFCSLHSALCHAHVPRKKKVPHKSRHPRQSYTHHCRAGGNPISRPPGFICTHPQVRLSLIARATTLDRHHLDRDQLPPPTPFPTQYTGSGTALAAGENHQLCDVFAASESSQQTSRLRELPLARGARLRTTT